MESKILLFKKGTYTKSKVKTYATKSYPKNDESNRWIIEYYDVYEDGTFELTRMAECDKQDVNRVTYLLEQ